MLKAICDASYFPTSPAISGEIILLANKTNDVVAPLFWKSKTIAKVCTSSKDAETRACKKCMTDATYSAERIETMLFGTSRDQHLKVEIYTDSEPLLESIKSTKRVEEKNLFWSIEQMKESLHEETVSCFCYIPTGDNAADFLTKHKVETPDFFGIFRFGTFYKATKSKVVKLVKREHAYEIRMFEQGKMRDLSARQREGSYLASMLSEDY